MQTNQQTIITTELLLNPSKKQSTKQPVDYMKILHQLWLDKLGNGSETISTDHDQYAYSSSSNS